MYDPATGRFLTEDSWQCDNDNPMSYNAWLYVYGNPITFQDPTGFNPVEGTWIHQMIEDHYIIYYGTGRDIRKIFLFLAHRKT